MNRADLGHRKQFLRGKAAFHPILAQGFDREDDADSFVGGIRTVGTSVQVTTFRIPPGWFGVGRRWG